MSGLRLVADDRGNLVDADEATFRLLGYTREELLQMSIWDLTPGGNELDGLMLWQDFIKAGTQTGEYVLRTKGGRQLRFRYQARANVEPGRHESVLTPVD